MVRAGFKKSVWMLGGLFCACAIVSAQQPQPPAQLTESGQIAVAGRPTPYRIRHLPVMHDGTVVGMVSIGDVVKSRIMQQDAEVDSLKAYIGGAA